jgi:dihydroorotase
VRYLVTGGSVLTESGSEHLDIEFVDGAVSRLEAGIEPDGHEVVDASGSWVGPGFLDLHTHLREPGQEWKEDIDSGMAAAIAGGFTAVVAMPNTDPVIDAGHLAREITRHDPIRVIPSGAISLGQQGAHLAHLDDLWSAGVRLFTDDGHTVADAGLLRRAMEYLAQLGGLVAQHAEDPGLCRNGHMHEGTVSSRLGITGLPSAGEEVIVARDLKLVELTGCRYHIQHASTAGTVELIRSAKRAGLPVTAEVTPHHLMLDHREVESMDPVYKMYPPLRSPDDVAALREAVSDGTIDAIGTDHAPHAAFEKDVTFEEAPRGVVGLETAASIVRSATNLDQAAFFERMAIGPARVLGEASGPIGIGSTDLVVFDPDAEWVYDRPRSKSANSPWLGQTLTGAVTQVFTRSGLVSSDEEGDS